MIKVAIDAGHGSNTAGKRTPKLPDGTVMREHYANVGVANLLELELQRCGFETVRIAWDDENAHDDPDTSLSDRQNAIKNAGCDISISVHFNAHGDGSSFTSASGVGIYVHNKYAGDSNTLAKTIMKWLVKGTRQKDRGVTPAALALCNCSRTGCKASILLELAFMTNLDEATTMMIAPVFWKECAVEVARGLCEYANVPYVLEGTKVPKRVTNTSPKEDIVWLQSQLTKLVKGYTIKVTGVYDAPTRIALLMYWEQLGWGRHMEDDGKVAGASTINALAQGRKE